MSFIRWRQPHRSRYGVQRHISDIYATEAGVRRSLWEKTTTG